jgi:hypothetical protein
MIEWFSDGYSVNINAVILSYTKTKSGDELLIRPSIIPAEIEQQRTRKQKSLKSQCLMTLACTTFHT